MKQPLFLGSVALLIAIIAFCAGWVARQSLEPRYQFHVADDGTIIWRGDNRTGEVVGTSSMDRKWRRVDYP